MSNYSLHAMAIKTKAVGVRFPIDLIERIEKYQDEQGANFTEALISLVKKGLGGDETEPIKVSNNSLDERITNLIETKLDAMLDERVKQALDAMLDGKSISSADSSNSESIAEDVQIIPTDAIDRVGGEIPESLSWRDFHKRLDLPTTGNPSKAKGDIAIATAKRKGHGTWMMNSTTRKFTKLTEDD